MRIGGGEVAMEGYFFNLNNYFRTTIIVPYQVQMLWEE